MDVFEMLARAGAAALHREELRSFYLNIFASVIVRDFGGTLEMSRAEYDRLLDPFRENGNTGFEFCDTSDDPETIRLVVRPVTEADLAARS